MLLLATGCAAGHVDIGHNDPPGVVGASLTDYAGSWEGYAEAFKWSDQTDLVRLSLDESGNGAIEVGSADTPAPVISGGTPDEFIKPAHGLLRPGFDYSVADATVAGRRIRMSSNSQQPFSSFCAAFEPVLNDVGRYACLPSVGWSYDAANGCRLLDAQQTAFDCNRANCDKLCVCDADGCGAMLEYSDVQIDAALSSDGEELAGTFLVGSDRVYVRLMRTP